MPQLCPTIDCTLIYSFAQYMLITGNPLWADLALATPGSDKKPIKCKSYLHDLKPKCHKTYLSESALGISEFSSGTVLVMIKDLTFARNVKKKLSRTLL